MTGDCPYCPPDEYCKVVFERDLVIYIEIDKYPDSLKYSGIIIPRAHRATLFDLTQQEWNESFTLLIEVKEWMDAMYKPNGYNVGWNCYPTGGQDVMHAHMHVIPRFEQEPMAGKGIRAELKSERNKWGGI
tara:strand:+ start:3171 stop:3563 length:393 start_codon:yes stop_codon:yes gene_type:complete